MCYETRRGPSRRSFGCAKGRTYRVWPTLVPGESAKKGVPSRTEITGDAMDGRAERVTLSKGWHLCCAVEALDDILQRMDGHRIKKALCSENKALRASLALIRGV